MANKIICAALAMAFAAAPLTTTAQENMSIGIKTENLNKLEKPGEDFYEYACGGWMKNNPLPAAYSRFGSFESLNLQCEKQRNEILSELLTNTYPQGSNEQKISDYYKLALDSTRLNKEGAAPVKPYLKEIEKCKTKADLQALKEKYAFVGIGSFVGTYFGADEKDSKNNVLNVYQAGLTLDQKEYYLDNDSSTAAIREAYKKHIVRMFGIHGFDKATAEKKMNDILYIETELAKASRSRTELRDPQKNYNKITCAEFESKYPELRLSKLMTAKGVQPSAYEKLVLGQPEFAERANSLTKSLTADQLKSYFEWDLINASSEFLSDDINEAQFDFFGRTMAGRKVDHPRWKRALSKVEGVFGEAIGKIYVEKYFPASSKEKMEKLVRNLQIALGERIQAQEWMSQETKKNALEKLNAFYVKIGYPNKWKDYSKLTIDPQKSLFDNFLSCVKFKIQQEIEEKAGKPVDNEEWFMYPQTVNAYYNPTTNEICFPAGILQYPFFDPTADEAFNYGAIGVVIGHEMTHGFDDQGRQFDKDGNMKDWWTPADAENFKARTDKYADFFSAIKVLPDLNANGRLTLGENLADHGGLQVAWYAYKNATKGKELPTVDGITPDQRFFIAYAGVWAENITEQELRKRVKSDPHSMGRWRTNGALPHIDMWYDAFNITPADKMYLPKEQRLQLW